MHSAGKLFVVGCGAFTEDTLTIRAYQTLEKSDIIVGYKKYVEELKKIFPNKNFYSSPMKQEKERVKRALRLAKEGRKVSLISSGDAGIYGMAGLSYELANQLNLLDVNIEVIPGLPALSICSASLGAPLMNDFAVISFSNLLTNEEVIFQRLDFFLQSGSVIVIYNPVSKERRELFEKLWTKILEKRRGMWGGYVKHGGKIKEEKGVARLEDLPKDRFDMNTLIIVGNADTVLLGNYLITKRGYNIKEEGL
ncbi:MAG: precorrin-3B C(17)-methyltransferase [Proteobacteria bacterium]|nr:precorrin-3B C(17)-methyltransferase [Pseudomonadota bacterium]